ncbi:MAG: endonuclease, partial [Myxococcota bacterium]
CRLDGPAGRLACQDKEVSLAPVVPIRVFGPTFTEWSEGHPECTKRGQPFSGRRCAKQTSEDYRRMASDLYNLAPQLVRSSYLDRDLRAPLPEACEQDTRQGTLRPASTHRGSIARTYLYMAYTYPAHASLSPQMINVLERWNLEDPPSPQECGRGAAIAALQGNRNRFLEQGCGR